jgi:hypothetical protein
MLRNRFPEQCALKDPTVACPCHWTSLAEGNANFSIVIVFRYAADLMVCLEHRDSPSFLRCTADGKRFLMTTNSEAGEGESTPVTVVLNWAA